MRLVRLVKGVGTPMVSEEYTLAEDDAKVIYISRQGDCLNQFVTHRYQYRDTSSDGIDVFHHTGFAISQDPFFEPSSSEESTDYPEDPKIPSF